MASRGQQLGGKWSWSSVFPLEVTEGSSAQYTPFDALRTSLCRQREALGITMQTTRWCTRLIIPGDSPIQAEDKEGTLALINDHAMDQPLILTPTQVKWEARFNTDWPALWKTVNTITKKLKSPVATFIWRLLNVSLPWPSHEKCPLCSSPRASPSHLFLECPGTLWTSTLHLLWRPFSPLAKSTKKLSWLSGLNGSLSLG